MRPGWLHVGCGGVLGERFNRWGQSCFYCQRCDREWIRLWVEGITESLGAHFVEPEGPRWRMVERTEGKVRYTSLEPANPQAYREWLARRGAMQ